jgi:hypothetical protein
MFPARRRSWVIGALAALLLSAGLAAPASAAPAPTAAAAADFYRAPSPLPKGAPGSLIRFRTAAVQPVGAPLSTAWTVMYHSRDAQGRDVAVTGTVLRPNAPWTGAGPRAIVTLAPGTQGLGPQCAPSKQLVAGTEYEAPNIGLALAQGWVVVVTDYLGYTTGATPSYTVGPDMGHAVLDIVRAAAHVPGSGVQAGAPLAAWGYSQGGGAAGWATVLQPTYAPDLHLVVAAAGGVPADPKAVGDSLNGQLGAGFLLDAMIGNEVTYRQQWPFSPMLNAAGVAAVRTDESQCVNDSLTTFAFKDLNTYLKPGHSLQQFEAMPSVRRVLAQNQLTAQAAPRVPIYQYHAAGDEIVPLAQARALHQRWCAEGVQTRLDLFPADHITGESEGASAAVGWLRTGFAGLPEATNCLT